jgi:hypothetical protein
MASTPLDHNAQKANLVGTEKEQRFHTSRRSRVVGNQLEK